MQQDITKFQDKNYKSFQCNLDAFAYFALKKYYYLAAGKSSLTWQWTLEIRTKTSPNPNLLPDASAIFILKKKMFR